MELNCGLKPKIIFQISHSKTVVYLSNLRSCKSYDDLTVTISFPLPQSVVLGLKFNVE